MRGPFKLQEDLSVRVLVSPDRVVRQTCSGGMSGGHPRRGQPQTLAGARSQLRSSSVSVQALLYPSTQVQSVYDEYGEYYFAHK